MSKHNKRVAVKFEDPNGLCEACGRAVLQKVDLVRAVQFFETVAEMFEKGQIKQFVLTASDGEKLRVMLAQIEKELPIGKHPEEPGTHE